MSEASGCTRRGHLRSRPLRLREAPTRRALGCGQATRKSVGTSAGSSPVGRTPAPLHCPVDTFPALPRLWPVRAEAELAQRLCDSGILCRPCRATGSASQENRKPGGWDCEHLGDGPLLRAEAPLSLRDPTLFSLLCRETDRASVTNRRVLRALGCGPASWQLVKAPPAHGSSQCQLCPGDTHLPRGRGRS